MYNFGIDIILLTNKQLLLIASLVSLRRDVHRTIPAIIEQVKVRIVLYGIPEPWDPGTRAMPYMLL